MSLTVAANLSSPVGNAACLAACAEAVTVSGDFAALLLSAADEAPLIVPPEIAALIDAPDTPDAAETPANALQNLLAGLLAQQAPGAPAVAPAEGDGSPLATTIDGSARPTTNAKRLPPAGTASALTTGDPEAATAAPAMRGADNAAANPLPAAAKLADRGNGAGGPAGPDLSSTSGESANSGPQFAASLAQASGSRPGTAGSPAAGAHVATPLGTPAWAADFSQRVVMLARGDQQSAQITLNPAHLGPIEVRLSLSGGEATAIFVSPHGDVREALESALPRLREMFAGAGISLGQAQVNAQSHGSGGQQQASPGGASLADRAEFPGPLTDNDSGTRVMPLARGLIDTFA